MGGVCRFMHQCECGLAHCWMPHPHPPAGYQPRWLRLKGNLLFYFKVTEAGSWDREAGPKGVVILVNCIVEKKPTADQPHAFTLSTCVSWSGWGRDGAGRGGAGVGQSRVAWMCHLLSWCWLSLRV